MVRAAAGRPKTARAAATHPAPAAGRERMSRVDTAWLRMDNDVNLMMIVGVWLLKPAVDRGAVIDRVGRTLLQYARFRQRVAVDATGATWLDDERFDINRHVVQARLAPRRGQSQRAALQELIGSLATTPLDPGRPLWQFHLIDDYEGGSALVIRIHHCIGDGISLTAVMMSITDDGRLPPVPNRGDPPDPVEAHPGFFDELLNRPLGEAVAKAIQIYETGIGKAARALAGPHRSLGDSLLLARGLQHVIGDAAALALMEDDSTTRLKGKPSGEKLVAWCEPIALDRVKMIGKGLGCSINDVLLACVAGAFGSYLRSVGEDPYGKQIRAMVPVNLRPLEATSQLGNRFGLVPLVLPIGLENPVERVFTVRMRMNELKGSFQPLLAFGVLALSGILIKPLQDSLLGMFARKATAVMTNVPGPAKALVFCGSTLRQTMFWVPQSGDIGIGVSVLSYAGGVQFGLITDRRLCPDPQAIIDRFEPEFEKLLLLTMMLPWSE